MHSAKRLPRAGRSRCRMLSHRGQVPLGRQPTAVRRPARTYPPARRTFGAFRDENCPNVRTIYPHGLFSPHRPGTRSGRSHAVDSAGLARTHGRSTCEDGAHSISCERRSSVCYEPTPGTNRSTSVVLVPVRYRKKESATRFQYDGLAVCKPRVRRIMAYLGWTACAATERRPDLIRYPRLWSRRRTECGLRISIRPTR